MAIMCLDNCILATSQSHTLRQNPIQRTVRSVHMCVHCTVHNCCAQ